MITTGEADIAWDVGVDNIMALPTAAYLLAGAILSGPVSPVPRRATPLRMSTTPT
jgi:hypothetical protein